MPSTPQLPNHLMEYGRRPSKVDPNVSFRLTRQGRQGRHLFTPISQVLYADSLVDTSLMTLYAHQNYTQFCDDIEHAEGVCEWLAMSDLYLSQNELVRVVALVA